MFTPCSILIDKYTTYLMCFIARTLNPVSIRVCTLLSRHQSIYKHLPQKLRSVRTMASTTVPKTMKGVLIEKTGGVEVLQYRTDLPVPRPKDGEILVKNEFSGINYIDT